MKTIKIITTGILCLTNITVAVSQSKKEAKEHNIQSTTENVTDAKGTTYKDTYTVFDKNGNPTEITEYKKDGSEKSKIVYKYDNFKNKIEETEYEGTEIVSKRTFTYNSEGDKETELTYNAKGKLIKKEVFSYNNKGLRSEKKIYDGNNVLLETHTYTYQTKE